MIIPPYMFESYLQYGRVEGEKEKIKKTLDSIKKSALYVSSKKKNAPNAVAGTSGLCREVFDGVNGTAADKIVLVKKEGDSPYGDASVEEAYTYSGDTYNFFKDLFSRDSLDGQGIKIVSVVNDVIEQFNAAWNGSQVIYGSGDDKFLSRFTNSISIVGHELSHGIIEFTSGFVYENQSGALNEHIADVFGCLVEQYKLKQSAYDASWLVGKELIIGFKGEAIRSLKHPGMAYDDPEWGKDRQVYHMDDFVTLSVTEDFGGVHINSGIPNHAFYLLSMLMGGNAWEKAGKIWYESLVTIRNPTASFKQWANHTISTASRIYSQDSIEVKLTQQAWKLVGVLK